MKLLFAFCNVLVCFLAMGTPADSLRTEKHDEGLFVIHKVDESETLYSISKRYGSTIEFILKYNPIDETKIEIGQIIRVIIDQNENTSSPVITEENKNHKIHVVKSGETLYGISKTHNISIKELKKLNGLETNEIATGSKLVLALDTSANQSKNLSLEEKTRVPIKNDFQKYVVLSEDNMFSVAEKFDVKIDSIKKWNQLTAEAVQEGMILFIKTPVTDSSQIKPIHKSKKVATLDENGFNKILEEGIASVIDGVKTKKYLALHKNLPIGTNLEVKNMMNGRVVHVKVVGKLPETGINKNILLRLSQIAYDHLGILDAKTRVEIAYVKE